MSESAIQHAPIQPIAPALFAMQARYNTWFNRELARATARLRPPGLMVQLNHLHVMDCLWLHRFGVSDPALPPPRTMDEIRFADPRRWHRAQSVADRTLETLVAGSGETALNANIEFTTMAEGECITRPLWSLLAHLFNHQSLHRGEILCLLRLHDVGFGQSDLLPFSPEVPQAAPAEEGRARPGNRGKRATPRR